jgi:hypothetical protein
MQCTARQSRRSGAPIDSRHLDAKTVRIADDEVIVRRALHAIKACTLRRGSEPIPIEPVNANAEVIDPPGGAALFCRMIKPLPGRSRP